MTKKFSKKLSFPKNHDQNEYEVGYAKPPAKTRFQPGKSGNPQGRPRGARNKHAALNEERLKTIVLGEAYRTIPTHEAGKKITLSMAEAVMRSITVNAAKGDLRSQKLFIDLVNTTEAANKEHHSEYLKTMISYKIGWEEELERRHKNGISAPDPIPHPDDIIIDMITGSVRIRGPFTKEEKVKWDRQVKRLEDIEDEIQELEGILADKKMSEVHQAVKEEIGFMQSIHDMIKKAVGDAPYMIRSLNANPDK